jgi:hypothetical protein
VLQTQAVDGDAVAAAQPAAQPDITDDGAVIIARSDREQCGFKAARDIAACERVDSHTWADAETRCAIQ